MVLRDRLPSMSVFLHGFPNPIDLLFAGEFVSYVEAWEKFAPEIDSDAKSNSCKRSVLLGRFFEIVGGGYDSQTIQIMLRGASNSEQTLHVTSNSSI